MVVKVVKGETDFVGYTNKEATKKKMLENVLEAGDIYTRTGDLMKVDEKIGYILLIVLAIPLDGKVKMLVQLKWLQSWQSFQELTK